MPDYTPSQSMTITSCRCRQQVPPLTQVNLCRTTRLHNPCNNQIDVWLLYYIPQHRLWWNNISQPTLNWDKQGNTHHWEVFLAELAGCINPRWRHHKTDAPAMDGSECYDASLFSNIWSCAQMRYLVMFQFLHQLTAGFSRLSNCLYYQTILIHATELRTYLQVAENVLQCISK
jgi:hypothetical protein